jgi:DNA-directed RNA polymerase
LVPSDRPADVYALVADRVVQHLQTLTDPLAVEWLRFGVTRSTVKRSVMILPYGERGGVVARWSFDRPGTTSSLYLYDCKQLR